MDTNGSKNLSFNKSSLSSLKEELLKKQEEIKLKKLLPHHQIDNFKPACPQKATKEDKSRQPNKSSSKGTFLQNWKQVESEELEAQKKSKIILEKKAELYNHLSDAAGVSKLSDKFLVNFEQKKLEEAKLEPSTTQLNQEEENDDFSDNDDDWAEYTDCLGRTRKCLKTDLSSYKKRDSDLAKALGLLKASEEGQQISDEDKPLFVQKANDYLQKLREKWEQKEKELVDKVQNDKDIHYQDLLFDEARQHGVSYFNFSTDEEERRRQMAELLRTRVETERAQAEAAARRAERDAQLAAKLAAARAILRERAGLPPEDEDEKSKFEQSLAEFLNARKKEIEEKEKEEERRQKEELERERQKQRDAYIREWDIGKADLLEKKGFKIMSQEEYVEQQRSKRIDEFAPVTEKVGASKNSFDAKGKKVSAALIETLPEKKTWADVRPQVTSVYENLEEPCSNNILKFSSKLDQLKNQYSNFVFKEVIEPTPIENELSDEEDTTAHRNMKRKYKQSTGTEIAPPPTFDYYGPNSKYSKQKASFSSDMQESIAHGNKVLEAKEEKKKMAKEFDFLL